MSNLLKALEKVERERKITVKSISTEKGPIVIKRSIKEKPRDRSLYFTGPSAVATEEFRKLRTLIFKTSAAKPMQTILVTSAVPGEGKSTIASNLALVISQGVKEYALLIDCDLRNSHTSPFLGQNIPLGLSDYLMGKLNPTNLIVGTEIPKLSILPSGSITSNPAELLGSEKMRDLIKTLKSQHENRYIIIDSPPIVVTTEPIILSEMVDGVIVVVLAAKTPQEVVQRAIKGMDKEKILGIVLNQYKAKPNSYSYAYYYSKK
ncbi:MAG: CpsD/CapB family tyrosine-protein kinase [Candidatus Hodarchaeota archaeon]